MLPITFMALIDNEGDKELFRQIYDTYRTMLLGYAYKITNDVSLAEDAVSEAFLRLAKSFNNVHNFEVTKIASYTVIIVRNVCYDLLKSNDSDLTYIDEISNEEPETAVEDATVKQLLNSAVNDLPEIYKDSIILRYYYELSIIELSEMLGLSVSGVKKRISVALRLLRKELADDE